MYKNVCLYNYKKQNKKKKYATMRIIITHGL